jgi:hypothetical protein
MHLEFSYDGTETENIRINVSFPYNVICNDPIFKLSN